MAALSAKSWSGADVPLVDKAVQELNARLRGELIQPGDGAYDEARKVYNAMHDRRPALVVRAAGVADVMAAVHFAREHNLLLAVRGGGHSAPGFGTCDGGMVIDLKKMKGIRVDSGRRTARAEGGCTWGDLNHATHAFGLATTGGIVSTTGIAGFTLGGGMGYLARRCGHACDNLVSADVVLADGTFVTCSEEQERDLFWAIRGGGGNFGVVTSFEYRLHPVAEIFGGAIFFPLEGAAMRGYRDFILSAPEELGALFALTVAAPLPFLPEQWHGKPVSALVACWTGEPGQDETVLSACSRWAPIIGKFLTRMPYPAINTLFDELLPSGMQQYWKSHFAREISDAAVQTHLIHGARTPTIQSGMFIYPVDGACQRVSESETAFPNRHANFATMIAGGWPNPAENERNIAWVRDYYEALRPYSQGGGYVNVASGEDSASARVNYRQNYLRLVQVKTKYDPANLFRLNQNIVPAG
jgi:FAD/FMN-containing dehydrogenase